MSKSNSHPLPAYQLHRPSGRARVRLTDAASGRRKDVYLGVYKSAESYAEYERVVRDWLDGGKVVERSARQARAEITADRPDPRTMTVTQLARAYWHHLRQRHPGELTGHLFNIRSTLRLLRSTAGGLPAREFGPLMLRKAQGLMIAKWKRRSVNKGVQFIRAAFRWAVGEQLVPVEVWQALQAVPGLRRGEQGVKEGKKVQAVAIGNVDAIRPRLSPQVEALVDLMLLTGARCGELVNLKLADLNTSGNIWTAELADHKGSWRGKRRMVYFGPKAQAIIKGFMADRPIDKPLFSPREAVAIQMRKRCTTGKGRRPNQKASPKMTDRAVGDVYETKAVRKAIERACDAAGIPKWSPHQLRHAAATAIRKEFGLEAAAIILGHSSATLTDGVYAERNDDRAKEVLAKIG